MARAAKASLCLCEEFKDMHDERQKSYCNILMNMLL